MYINLMKIKIFKISYKKDNKNKFKIISKDKLIIKLI